MLQMELTVYSGSSQTRIHNGCVAECTVGVLCDSDILPLFEVWSTDAVVWVGESEGKARIGTRENIQNIGVDVLIRLQKREFRKTSISVTRLEIFYPVC